MLARLTSRRNALRLFGASTVFMIVLYVVVFFTPPINQAGQIGIYILPVLITLTRLYMLTWGLLIVSVIWYAIRSRSLNKTGALTLAAFLLFVPTLLGSNSVSRLLQDHVMTLAVNDHVYQLSEGMYKSCRDTFDLKSYPCYSHVFVYQCDRSGLVCSLKSPIDLEVLQQKSLSLKLEGQAIEVIGDDGTVVYSLVE